MITNVEECDNKKHSNQMTQSHVFSRIDFFMRLNINASSEVLSETSSFSANIGVVIFARFIP